MPNYFWKLPINHGDTNIWGPKALKNFLHSVPDINTYLYDDAGTLKVSKGWIGINDGTVEGVSEIDTVTTISIAGISTGNWAEIYMSVSGTTVTFAAVDIAGATTEADIPSAFLNAYDTVKGGYYINSARRCIGIVWKTGGGALSHIINASSNTIDIFRGNVYARDSNGITFKDYNRNPWFNLVDGGKKIGVFTDDVEAWDSTFDVLESKMGAIAFNNSSIAMSIISNAYYDGSWKYKSTEQAMFQNFNADGSIRFNTAASGTIDTAITWTTKFKIAADTTDAVGIGGYAGGANRDSYFYFADDSYIFWDESESKYLLYIAGSLEYSFESQTFGMAGGAGATDINTKIAFASNAWILWEETAEKYTFRIAGTDGFTVASNTLGLAGGAGAADGDSRFSMASDASIFWDESADRFIINKGINPTGAGTLNMGTASVYWDDINAKDFLDRSAIWIEDPDTAYETLKNATNEEEFGYCAKVESRGQHRLKYSAFPNYCWDNALVENENDIIFEDGDIIIEESFKSQNKERPDYKKNDKIITAGEPSRLRAKIKQDGKKEISIAAEGFSISAGISVLFGAVQKLIEKVEALEGK